MNHRMRQILDQIVALEDELHEVIEEQGENFRYQIDGKRVVFEEAMEQAHQRIKLSILPWFLTVRPQNFLTMPFIYGMAAPLVLLDLCVTIYQWISFPIYGIAKVKRSDFLVMDHQHLSYLNFIEKIHCLYCSYAVGMLAYAGEVTARTEQYFCPIKHAKKIRSIHSRYKRFLDYGEADNFHAKLEEIRSELAHERDAQSGNKR